jgi:hypothetical protein
VPARGAASLNQARCRCRRANRIAPSDPVFEGPACIDTETDLDLLISKYVPAIRHWANRRDGARRTTTWLDPKNGLALVILVERFDMPGDQQKEMYSRIMKAAIEKFGDAAR